MQRIALYIPSLSGGGAERVMLTLANAFVEKDIKVDLILNRLDGPYLKDASKKVNIVNLNTSRVLNSVIPLARYLRREKPDAILSAMNYVNIITVVAHIISRTNTRVVVSEHANLTESKKNLGRIKGAVITILMKWAYSKSNAIIAVSDGVADELSSELKTNRKKITTIYNPIFSENLLKRSKEMVFHPWVEDNETPFILAVGRLTVQKDFATLIHAFKQVIEQKPCNLIILGEGSLRPDLERLVEDLELQDNIELVGFVDNPYAWMSKADLFVLSSIQESFGNVLVEAMACGTPIVSTNCPSGPKEILEEGQWGELVPPANANLLAKAILKSMNTTNDKNLRKRAAFFSVDNAVDKYLSILMNH